MQVRNEADKIKFLTTINGLFGANWGQHDLATLSSASCNFQETSSSNMEFYVQTL